MEFPRFSARPGRMLLGGLLAILIVTGIGWLATRHATLSPSPVERTPSATGPRSYADARLKLDRDIDGAAELLRIQRGQWVFEERLAQLLIARGRLAGSFADYAAAQAALDRAFAESPQGAGPHLA